MGRQSFGRAAQFAHATCAASRHWRKVRGKSDLLGTGGGGWDRAILPQDSYIRFQQSNKRDKNRTQKRRYSRAGEQRSEGSKGKWVAEDAGERTNPRLRGPRTVVVSWLRASPKARRSRMGDLGCGGRRGSRHLGVGARLWPVGGCCSAGWDASATVENGNLRPDNDRRLRFAAGSGNCPEID